MIKSKTFTIIKPDAVADNNIGKILAVITDAGFTIRAMKLIEPGFDRMEDFYYEHKGRPYFDSLVAFMGSGPIVVAVLQKYGTKQAVAEYRALMGATKVEDRAPGTIRKLFGTSLMYNAVHGSDSDDNAEREIEFFFAPSEIF